jgi:histidine ammonia-lyase
MSQPVHHVTLDFYTLDDMRRIVDELPQLALSDEVKERIDGGAQFVREKAAEDRYIYGVNTGFGSLCETRVESTEMETLQFNHVVSHAVGVGDIVPERISRIAMLIKLLTFRSGRTGISRDPVDRFVELWNRDIIPTIPKKGTVGASGDLAPLAHMGLPLLGLGSVHVNGSVKPTSEVLDTLGWEPLRLKPKEGLAITNGVQYINAIAVDCLIQIEELVRCADILGSLSAQAFSTSRTFYQPQYHLTSYHPERQDVAANLRTLLDGSNHWDLPTCNRSMQDPYSFRCIPQVHGAVRQAVRFSREIIERECNGTSDNPLFFPEEDLILFGGNLHGQSTAMVLDLLAMALTELTSISERRTYQLLSGTRGLPDFLVGNPGLNSGMMITQYTSAALVNESKVLSNPASVDTIMTAQLQEDSVSMGGTSAYKLQTIIDNCHYVFGIELLNAAQAIEMNEALQPSPIAKRIVGDFREHVAFLDKDRILADDMQVARDFLTEHRRSWASELSLQ